MKTLLPLFFAICSFALSAQPVITQNPSDLSLCQDSCAFTGIVATGDGILTYEWQKDDNGTWAPLSANMATIQFCGDSVNYDSVAVRCIVTDSNGFSDTSSAAIVQTNKCQQPVADFEFTIYGDSVCFDNTSQFAETVLWNFGNGGQSSAFSPCYDYMDFQIFYARLYVFNAYGSDEIEKEIDLLSISESRSNNLKVFPIPAKNTLFIQSDGAIEWVQLTNMLGVKETLEMHGSNKPYVDVSHLPAGMYFIEIQTQLGAFTQRVIID